MNAHAQTASQAVLQISDLKIDLYTETACVRAVDGVSLEVAPGELVAIVGESGSGKTVLTLAPLGLMPEGVSLDIAGSVKCRGDELVGKTGSASTALTRGDVGVVFQDPISALNPMKKIGPQLCSQAMRKRGVSRTEGRQIAIDLLKRTGIPDPEDRYNRYPHEMSGGMLQRAMIALALAGNPRLLIADEPTTALDATVRAQILELIKDIQRTEGIAVVLITHDIGVVSSVADRVVVLYAGRIAEIGSVENVLTAPVHPYTKGLLASVPEIRSEMRGTVSGIPGSPPNQSHLHRGCPFSPRCSVAIPDYCDRNRPRLLPIPDRSEGDRAACHVTNPANKDA